MDAAFALTLRPACDHSLLATAPGFATGELELEGFDPERGRDGLGTTASRARRSARTARSA